MLEASCVCCVQVLKASHDVAEHLSKLQAGFKRTLTTDSKAFKAEAIIFRWLLLVHMLYSTYETC